MKTIKLGIVMDPIQSIHFKKDSSLAMLLEAQDRGWELVYFEQKDLFLKDATPFGFGKTLEVKNDPNNWYGFEEEMTVPLGDLDVILMRKDPPFNAQYIYTTYILDHAERLGALVVNRPQSLRDANEKIYTTSFPECCTKSVVSRSAAVLKTFWQEEKDIVCKPLDVMGGTSIFRLTEKDVNANVIFDMLTNQGHSFVMAQKYIPEIVKGDKRILLINGEAVPFALARIPQGDDWRGNLAVGAKGVIEPITPRDQWICEQIGPALKERGLYFVGIDIIGDYLTEINVTSPTGIRELSEGTGINISGLLMDVIASEIKTT